MEHVGVVCSVELDGPDGSLIQDVSLSFGSSASVSDLVGLFIDGDAQAWILLFRDAVLAPDVLLSDLGISHGELLRITSAGQIDAWPTRLSTVRSRLCLVQLDGAERGKVQGIPAEPGLGAILVASSGSCWTRFVEQDGDRLAVAARFVDDPNGLMVEPGERCRIDGEAFSNPVLVLPGSVITLGSPVVRDDGAEWELSFEVVERDRVESAASGMVAYRVVSEGWDEPPPPFAELVPGSRPREPQKKSLSDYLFEFLPMVALSAMFAFQGGFSLARLLVPLAYGGVYGIRMYMQVRKHREATRTYEAQLVRWQHRVDSYVMAYREYVLDEHDARSTTLLGTLNERDRWRAFNRMDGLWSREDTNDHFLDVWIANGRWRSAVPFEVPAGLDEDEHAALLARVETVRTIDNAPITLHVGSRDVAVVGGRSASLAAVRLVVFDLALNHSPRNMGLVAFLPSAGADMDAFAQSLKWIPHVRLASGVFPGHRVVRGPAAANKFLVDVVSALRSVEPDVAAAVHMVFVVHEASGVDVSLLEECSKLGRNAVHIVWWGPAMDRVPKLVTQRLAIGSETFESGAPKFALLDSYGLGVIGEGDDDSARHRLQLRSIADSSSESSLEQLARALAPLTDERVGRAGSVVPTTCTLDQLLMLDHQLWNSEHLEYISRDQTTVSGLTISLGTGAGGPVEFDIVENGPHMLVGGTTGSGKSEFLQGVVLTAAARYRSSELNFVLIDFKGGAAFDSLSGLPHLAAEASNLEPRSMRRVLAYLRGEMDFRMKQLRREGAKDFEEFRATCPEADGVLPRLLIVLDEFAAAKGQYPEVAPLIDSIAARGRSLGMHVVFATQNPSGAVTADMATNIGARVCLRMLTKADAKSVVASDRPAFIPTHLPGRGFARLADGDLKEFQAPWVSQPLSSGPGELVSVERFVGEFQPSRGAERDDRRSHV